MRPSNMENANSNDYLNKIKNTVIENIRRTGRPSVEAFQTIPPNPLTRGMESDDEDEEDDLDADLNPDKRLTQRQRDQMVVPENEFDDASDDEEYRDSLGVRRQPGEERRRGIMSFQNPDAVPDEVDVPHTMNGDIARAARSTSLASSRQPANGTSHPVAADEDGDIDMENATPAENQTPAQPANGSVNDTAAANLSLDASPAGVVTPPDSPPAALVAAPTTADVAMDDTPVDAEDRAQAIQKEKDEGLKERVEEEERGEAQTEAMADK